MLVFPSDPHVVGLSSHGSCTYVVGVLITLLACVWCRRAFGLQDESWILHFLRKPVAAASTTCRRRLRRVLLVCTPPKAFPLRSAFPFLSRGIISLLLYMSLYTL